MMMKFRKQISKIVVVMLFGLLVMSFAFWGIGDIFRGGGRIETVAEVGGTTIDQRSFGRALSREVNRMQRRFNSRLESDQIRALGIPQQVLDQMISEALFEEAANRMGLAVSDDRIRRAIAEEPLFKDAAGAFSRGQYDQVLRSNGLSEDAYVSQLRGDLRREQISQAASLSVVVSREFLETFYRYREERRTAETILVPAGDGADLPEPGQSALTETHEAFAQRFENPEYRAITLVELRADDLLDEIVVDEEEIRSEFEIRRDEFSEPERRSLEQVVLDGEALAKDLRATLDEGWTFAAAAESVVGREPVVLEGVTRVDLTAQSPDLAEAVFSLVEGAIAGPLRSPFGWHVLRLSAIEAAFEAELGDVSEDLRAELARRQAVDSLVSIANQLDDELASGASLDEAAYQLGLTARGISAIDRGGQDRAGTRIEVPAPALLLPAVFSTPAGEEGLLTETPEGDFFIYRVDRITPPALKPLAEVREEVTALWRTEEAKRRAAERAATLADRVRLGDSFAEVATEEGLSVSTVGPLDRLATEPAAATQPGLTARVFELRPDEVATAETRGDWVVVRLLDVRPGDPDVDPEALTALADGLTGSLRNDLMTALTAELNRQIGVAVNQRALDAAMGVF